MILTAAPVATKASLGWLLEAAGATGCGPAIPSGVAPLAVSAVTAGSDRDPDDLLAVAAHELLGLDDGIDRTSPWVTNGWSTIRGPLSVTDTDRRRRGPWWRRG